MKVLHLPSVTSAHSSPLWARAALLAAQSRHVLISNRSGFGFTTMQLLAASLLGVETLFILPKPLWRALQADALKWLNPQQQAWFASQTTMTPAFLRRHREEVDFTRYGLVIYYLNSLSPTDLDLLHVALEKTQVWFRTHASQNAPRQLMKARSLLGRHEITLLLPPSSF
jgi:hypothetical protein